MKVLITADIHINDYANYNYTPKSRLKQFVTLANRLVELGKSSECTELWILGDLVDKPSSRPYILHEAWKFMQIVCGNFTKVRYILGNHDLDTKSQSLSEEDSQVTIFEADNLIYMDQMAIEFDGHLFGFMNWRPEQDLTWLGDKHLDVLLGHYTKSELFGQDIDDTKFDLMIHGDIHNSQVIGKFISVCNPIQKDMSSEAEGKLLVLDTSTLKWERILVDPDNTRFLQMHYTKDPEEEGFKTEFYYRIYKPSITVQAGEISTVIDWTDMDDLIKKSCEENHVMDIHEEVTSQVEMIDEVDFNFQLIDINIHGFRSIEDLHLDFKEGDRIALLGANGSGKTSVIRALQGVFGKNSDLKWEQSEFTQDMLIEIKLLYQNKLYYIKKGSQWGLSIDGVDQGYSGIREFESDLVNKLPFIGYLDLMFLNSNTSDLTSQLSSSRRIDLISKFYRLTKIESYHQTALELWKDRIRIYNDLYQQVQSKQSQLDLVNTRLGELSEYETLTKDPIISEMKDLNNKRVQLESYKNWKSRVDQLKSKVNELHSRLESAKQYIGFNSDQAQVEVEELKVKKSQLSTSIQESKQKLSRFESLCLELDSTAKEGSALNSKIADLDKGICPECGAKLVSGKLKDLNESYQIKLQELRSKWSALDAELKSHPQGRDSRVFYKNLITELESEDTRCFNAIELLQNKIQLNQTHKVQYQERKKQYDEVEAELLQLEASPVEYIELPYNLEDIEQTLLSKLSKIDECANLKATKESVTSELNDLTLQMNQADEVAQRYILYSELTQNTGVIMEAILRQLAVKFSTQDVKYEVDSGVYRGSRFINFDTYYLVKGNYRRYDQCSAGQKTVCDLDFLCRLFSTRMGLLVLDEYLKHLDEVNFTKVCSMLTEMGVNTILLSTHDDNLTSYTKRLLLSLDDSGRTKCVHG